MSTPEYDDTFADQLYDKLCRMPERFSHANGVCWTVDRQAFRDELRILLATVHTEEFTAGVKAAALIADNVYAAYLRQADELRQPPPERWPDIEKAECRADGAHIVRDNIHDLITPG